MIHRVQQNRLCLIAAVSDKIANLGSLLTPCTLRINIIDTVGLLGRKRCALHPFIRSIFYRCQERLFLIDKLFISLRKLSQ